MLVYQRVIGCPWPGVLQGFALHDQCWTVYGEGQALEVAFINHWIPSGNLT